MIDKREGFEKRPVPSQENYFPQNEPVMPNKGNVQPSQKKAPGPVKPE